MKEWFRALFRPNVDGVLKNFHRTIAKLETAKAWNDEESARQSALIKQAETEREACQKEALRADHVASKLKEIVGL
jgi:hypothetical protein